MDVLETDHPRHEDNVKGDSAEEQLGVIRGYDRLQLKMKRMADPAAKNIEVESTFGLEPEREEVKNG